MVFPIQLLALDSTTPEADVPLEVEIDHQTPWPLRLAHKKRSWWEKVRVVGLVKKAIMKLKEKVDRKLDPTKRSRLRPRLTVPTEKVKVLCLSVSERNDAEMLLIKAIPVSYTHLTLPTICSV